VTYLAFWVPGLAVGETLTPLGITIAVVALWIFTAINVIGVKWGGLYSLVTTIGKIIPLVVFAAVGLSFFGGANFVPLLPFGLTGITLAMAFEFWAFTGFESVVVPTEEVKNPEKTIPRAMLLTMGIVITVYVLIAVAFVGMIDWSGLGIAVGDWGAIGNLTSPLSDVAQAAGLPILAIVATVGALISTAGSGGDWVLLQGRIPYAMAKDGLFWGPMDSVHHKWGTPFLALIFASLLTMIIQVFIPNFPSVALIASITALVPYAAAVLSVPILRKTKPDANRPFKLPFPVVVTGLGFILATLLVYWASWPWTLIGAILMLAGYPLYLTFKDKKFEFTRNLWILVYLVFIIVMSLVGDTNFIYENFLPIGPLGLIPMPYDIVVVTIFAILIYTWAYKANTREVVN
jgi:amino acid transporter